MLLLIILLCLATYWAGACDSAGGIVNSAVDFQRYMLDSVMSNNDNFFPAAGSGQWSGYSVGYAESIRRRAISNSDLSDKAGD